MRTTHSLIIALVGLLFVVILNKPALAAPCSVPGSIIFFANGVDTDWVDAKIEMKRLGRDFDSFRRDTSLDSECIEYKVAYNQNEKFFLDLFEAYTQASGDFSSGFWRFLSGIDAAPDWFQNLAIQSARSIDAGTYLISSDLQTHVRDYREALSQGHHRVLVVSHSQGNFYANEAHRVLYGGFDNLGALQTRSFGIVSVATPASFVADDGPYTTKRGDFIWTMPLNPAPLPFNLIEDCGGPFDCHAFVRSYLNGNISGPRIMGHIETVLGSLERPSGIPAFNYSLSAFNTSVRVLQGASVSNPITRNIIQGLSEAVTLSVGVLPPGASVTTTNNPCNPTCSSSLVISTTTLTPTGTYQITVTGAPLNKSVAFDLIVEAFSPPVFQCSDGIDNDNDGKIDFPNDPGCSSPDDDNENDAAIPTISSLTATPSTVFFLPAPCGAIGDRQSIISIVAEGNNLTYSWAASVGNLSATTGPENKTWTAPLRTGTFTAIITVTVTDSSGLSSVASVDITWGGDICIIEI